MKVSVISGVHSEIDSTRGVGANNSELFKAVEKINNKGQIEFVSDPKKADLTHYTKFNPFFVSLPFSKPSKKIVLTIHDLTMLVYPDHYKSGIRGSIKFLINKFLIKKNVDHIITITETSKKDICRFLKIDPSKISVIYLAAKSVMKKLDEGSWKEETRKKFNLPDKFVLFDHGVNYNKNLPTLIKACRIAKVPLAIVGKETENIGKLDLNHPELAHLKGVDFSGVHKLGFVSDEDLNKLFNIASVCVEPSYYEGFGMPVIEAMKVGCPVIASQTQALVEIGDKACVYFNPHDEKELAEKIKLVLKDKKIRQEYINKGYEQAKKYSWEKAAKETLDVYKNI
jgi:glycosyltransferase involved in cell wall biosynthesis